jgi:two-component system, sensor histidine kinase
MSMLHTRSFFADANSTGQAQLVANIRDELVDQWIGDTPKRIPMLPVFGVLVAALLHSTVPTNGLVLWLAAVTLSVVWRYTVYTRYRRGGESAAARVASARRKGLLTEATLSVAVIGLVWGISMVFCHQYPVSAAAQSTVGIIAAGLGIVALSGMYPRAGITMTICIFLPFIVWARFYGDFQQWLLAAGSTMYIGVLILWSRGLYTNVVKTMLLRHENDALVKELSVAKEKAEIANLEKSRFLAAASHDLRQPMQGLWLFVGNLRQQWGRPGAVKILDHIENSLDAMRSLFDALLNISQLDSGGVEANFRHFAIQDSLSRIESEFSAECDRKMLRFKVWPNAAWVHSDPALLDRILLNFVANAVKYTPTGGGILVACRRRGERLDIQVWDTGLGVPVKDQESIFNEFVQLNNPERDRNKGLGLGLAISRRLAVILGATIGLRSRPGHGSVFSVSVPMAAEQAEASRQTETLPRRSSQLRGLRLAFVDDEPNIIQAVCEMCAPWGVEVVSASGLDTLLDKLGDQPPHGILTDYRLRDGKTGMELIDAVRQRWPLQAEIPATVLTGDTETDLVASAKSKRISIIYKPISPATLEDILKALVPA